MIVCYASERRRSQLAAWPPEEKVDAGVWLERLLATKQGIRTRFCMMSGPIWGMTETFVKLALPGCAGRGWVAAVPQFSPNIFQSKTLISFWGGLCATQGGSTNAQCCVARTLTTAIFVLKIFVFKIPDSRVSISNKNDSNLYSRPLGTSYPFKICPDSRLRIPESWAGGRPYAQSTY